MGYRRALFVGVLVVLFVPLTVLLWQFRPVNEEPLPTAAVTALPAEVAVSITAEARVATTTPGEGIGPAEAREGERRLAPTYTPRASASPIVTAGSVATATPERATPAPTEDAQASATATATIAPVIDPIDRSCPDPPPLKPDYDRYYLDGESWPSPNPATGSHLWFIRPYGGVGRLLYTQWYPYGYDGGGRYLLHNGIDMAEPLGAPLVAVAEGTVVVAGADDEAWYGWRCDWYGHLVVIELDDRWMNQPVYVLYGHVLGITVEPGQRVLRGDQVAEVGFGGVAEAPHLHFEVRVGENAFGATRNPLLWIAPPSTRGVIAGRLVDPAGRPWQGVVVTAIGRSEETEDASTWTYLGDPQHLSNADEALAENFVLADMKPGSYELIVGLQGVEYRAEVTVVGGELATVEIVTEPLRPPTPEAVEATATAEGS